MSFPARTISKTMLAGLTLSIVSLSTARGEPLKAPAQDRTFLFTYGATVTGLPEGKKARIWLPVPSMNRDQAVKIESQKLPKGFKISTDKKSGNRYLYVETGPDSKGEVPLSITYLVNRQEVRGPSKNETEPAEQLVRFLQADAMVPIAGKPLDHIKEKLLGGKQLPKDPEAAARAVYDSVNEHMKYDKPAGKPWGRGDSVWACDSGYGNCTDFHSLFMSLARSQKIPVKFEIGFPLPAKHGEGAIPGYHCWAKFKPQGKGWIPVDISEANKDPKLRDYYFGNLTPDRVMFSTGRDLELVPKQAGPPLNFFVYPYVEVDGKPYPADKVKRSFPLQGRGEVIKHCAFGKNEKCSSAGRAGPTCLVGPALPAEPDFGTLLATEDTKGTEKKERNQHGPLIMTCR